MKKYNPLDYPISLLYPTRVASSHWTEHVPFAMTLIDLIRPGVFAELGTFAGVSYCAFCQAIVHLHLATRAYAVDTWKGDPHNGANGPEILTELRGFHDTRYSSFSRLVQSTFDEAMPHFADGSIDLLHIDGYHTYDAVRHDFTNWLPKLSPRGVVILHDINVRERDFGVWRFWNEIKDRYPAFELLHQHGLGLVAVGQDIPEALRVLLESSEEELVLIREYYFGLGQRITARWQRASLEHQFAEEQVRHEAQLSEHRAQYHAQLNEQRAHHEAQRGELQVLVEQLRVSHAHALAEEQVHLAAVQSKLADSERLSCESQAELEEKNRRLEAVESAHQAIQSKLAKIEQLLRVSQAQLEEKNHRLQKVESMGAALQAELAEREAQTNALSKAAGHWEEQYRALQAEATRAQSGEQTLHGLLQQIQSSLAWRFARVLSRCFHLLVPTGTRRDRMLTSLRRAGSVLCCEGPIVFLSKVRSKLRRLIWQPRAAC